MSDAITIYHNPRCSKSRQTLELIQQQGIEPEVVLYLQTPPSAQQLKKLAKALNMKPAQFVRKGEAQYKELGLNEGSPTDKILYEAMAAHPKLIERPIVVKGETAVLGRPPENVLSLLA